MAEASPPERGKMKFRRNAISFPGNLHLVLVLHPTGIIQQTFTDTGFRLSQEDFMLKLPVIMLSSVSDLLTYVDGKQLTPELGGTLQYCHSEWILFRNAIENFAVTVKEMAQMLQAFGTELAETELPNDIPSLEKILALRTDRYHVLKNDITAVTKEGKILLTTMEVPNTCETFSSSLACQPCIRGDWKTINKLLAQVHDMETAFDGFWEKHQLKLEQYLQLWKFEHDFKEIVARVEFLLNQQEDLGNVSGNLAQVRQKVKKIEILDEKAQELLSKSHFLILHGHKLASSHHYALDLICQRCNELRYVSDVLVNETRAKRIQLSKTFKMHKLLQQAGQCCNEGECLLDNQEADETQSEDGQKALQDLENFLQVALPFINYNAEALQYEFDVLLSPELKVQLETVQLKLENVRSLFENQHGGFKTLKGNPEFAVCTSQSVVEPRTLLSPKHVRKSWRLSQRSMNIEGVQGCQEQRNSDDASNLNNDERLDILKSHILNELIETEKTYVRELFSVLLGYRAEMDNPQMFDLMPSVLRNKKDVLFGNMAEIYEFHNNIFMGSLETCFDAPERVGPCFLERKRDFQMYAKYCQNKPRSEKIWRKYSECAFFRECQRKLKHRLGLDSYLLKPVQRITKYQLLLKELLKCTEGNEGSTMLKEALDTMLDLLKSVNDSMHVTAINGYSGNLSELGKMILQGGFSVWIGHRKGAPKMKDFARFKSMQRHIFLYEKAVMFCKRRVESGVDCDRYPSYSFKHCLKMEEVGITEFVKGDSRKFEIWYHEKEEIYIVQAPNIDVKMLWLKELRNLSLKAKQLIPAKTKKQEDHVAGKDQVSPRQNVEKQEDASVKIDEAELEQASAVVDISKRVVPIQAEASRVCTEKPPSTYDPAMPAESSRRYRYHASDGNEEPRTQVTGPEKRASPNRVYL